MQFYLFTFVILVFYLLLTNFLKKFNFSLDKDAINEKHKSLLRKIALLHSWTFIFYH